MLAITSPGGFQAKAIGALSSDRTLWTLPSEPTRSRPDPCDSETADNKMEPPSGEYSGALNDNGARSQAVSVTSGASDKSERRATPGWSTDEPPTWTTMSRLVGDHDQ